MFHWIVLLTLSHQLCELFQCRRGHIWPKSCVDDVAFWYCGWTGSSQWSRCCGCGYSCCCYLIHNRHTIGAHSLAYLIKFEMFCGRRGSDIKHFKSVLTIGSVQFVRWALHSNIVYPLSKGVWHVWLKITHKNVHLDNVKFILGLHPSLANWIIALRTADSIEHRQQQNQLMVFRIGHWRKINAELLNRAYPNTLPILIIDG